MSGLYLTYPKNTLIQIDTIRKVDISTLIKLVTEILPPHASPLNYKSIDNSFYLTFVHEKDVNLFFEPANAQKLKKYNLIPTNSPHSKCNREIYLPGVSKNIYYLPKDKIIAELKNNNINPLYINLFTSLGGTPGTVFSQQTPGQPAIRLSILLSNYLTPD